MSCDNVKTSSTTLIAAIGEIVKKEFDFASGGDMATGETVSSVSSTVVDPASEVTVSGTSISGAIVQITLNCAAGVAKKVYKITCTVVTSNSQTLKGSGLLMIGTA